MRYQDILEAKHFTITVHFGRNEYQAAVYMNPAPSVLKRMRGTYCRIILTRQGDLYLWDGDLALHDDVQDALRIEGKFYLTTEEGDHEIMSCSAAAPGDYLDSSWVQNANLQRLYGGEPPVAKIVMTRYWDK